MDNKTQLIELMIEADVLRFGEFTTKSGRLSPYFVNTGNYKTSKQLTKLGKFYGDMIKDTCSDNFDAMFGPAYKGIPLAVSAAVSLMNDYNIDKPIFYNRKEVKDHGEGGMFIGYIPKDGDNVIIIEDVITAGTQIRDIMPHLKSIANIKITDMFISVDRCEVGLAGNKTAVMEVRDDFGISVHSIVNVLDIREFLKNNGKYDQYIPKMDAYIDQYCLFK